jgi:hypothetical protein
VRPVATGNAGGRRAAARDRLTAQANRRGPSGPRKWLKSSYLLLPSAGSGGSTTDRPSMGNALSPTLKPKPCLCGKATPTLVQRAGIVASFPGRGESVHRRPLDAAGKTCRAFAILRRAENRWFAIPVKPRLAHAPSPCFSRSGKQEAILRCEDDTMALEPALTFVDAKRGALAGPEDRSSSATWVGRRSRPVAGPPTCHPAGTPSVRC